MSKSPGDVALGAVNNTGLGVSKLPGDVALIAVKNTGRVDGTGPRRDESSGYRCEEGGGGGGGDVKCLSLDEKNLLLHFFVTRYVQCRMLNSTNARVYTVCTMGCTHALCDQSLQCLSMVPMSVPMSVGSFFRGGEHGKCQICILRNVPIWYFFDRTHKYIKNYR